ncbi:HIS2 (YFR025C) [Zygosaccharomyces parabailii]|uniref:Histidinol-phosphatase n=1 Tax=Zygosaccharomyces bailii (strain CLIB 213 / ATCC 58445 / CBS 680 / BCRC 21525 / NBRC 1098 / NCYC 1416 / NRRL Y-2227) TaxID=1333698 RepID=A0A8J2TA29_ZYGB2|nr:HIS2 (YFR025C) [Zygosaccharomyces parabailii]CDF91670.1 ZYBA0S13-00870g1_1 [Zygosaccharomyces bailii CLIB 213]CDH16780.1 probable Histidinol-phosphatase [Zygosaccharomyces bailii ISA1307]
MHSHHSHSGDYVAHGADPLEDITARAIEMGFATYCLTEHMPRINSKFLYPEEEEKTTDQTVALKKLSSDFLAFLNHASLIKSRPNPSNTRFIIGTEIEGCDEEHIAYAKKLVDQHKDTIEFCVGSVHHVRGVPIDFDQEGWNRSLALCDNNIQKMLLSYFDLQYKMITTLKPLVVGHFDLYKLYLPPELKIDPRTGAVSNDPDSVPVSTLSLIDQWDSVKESVVRNLQVVRSYGGLVEINTAALRKKLPEPYPGKEVCELVKLHCDGKFVLSDDAHAVPQVGVCYRQALKYIVETLQLSHMYYLQSGTNGVVQVKSMPIEQFKSNAFWSGL